MPTGAGNSDTGPARARWLRPIGGALLLAFWLCLLFFPEHPAAHGVIAGLALAAAAAGVARAESGWRRLRLVDAAPYIATRCC